MIVYSVREANQKKKVTFEIGEQVWVYQPEAQEKDGKVIQKSTYQWHGPMTIVEKHT